MATKVSNIKELRDALSGKFEVLCDGGMDHKEAHEISNMAGKIVNTVKIELANNVHLKKEKEIPYLNY